MRLHKHPVQALLASALLLTGSCGLDDLLDEASTGTLVFTIDGEEFAREGMQSTDGWSIHFEQVLVHVESPTAVQVAVDDDGGLRPAHPGHDHAVIPDGAAHETLGGGFAVDLAEGDGPLELGRLNGVAIGNYNVLHFDLAPAPASTVDLATDMPGSSMLLAGIAEAPDGVTSVHFRIRIDEQLRFRNCGPTEDGIVGIGGTGTVEITLHLDHLFGDAEDGDDEMNQAAVGFGPFANLAANGTLDVDQDELRDGWTGRQYLQFRDALHSIGHTGEAHCQME